MKKRLLALSLVIAVFSCKSEKENSPDVLIKDQGRIFGTTYLIQYDSSESFEADIQRLFSSINQSLSTYIPGSLISKINRNENSEIDYHFKRVFDASLKAYEETGGAFDPTIGAVVNAWDFGPEGKIVDIDSSKIDSLMNSVGLSKLKRDQEKLNKPDETYLDFNAIAKGYAVDAVSELLMAKGIKNYLVEIGGEMRSGGRNTQSGKPWRVGIYKPTFDGSNEVFMAFNLGENAMATSGVYRKFKIDENGNRYAHIIDTKTGYPSKTNILSVSVIAEDCTMADAYATAFQAMGMGHVEDFIDNRPGIKVYFIFENENGELDTRSLNDFPED